MPKVRTAVAGLLVVLVAIGVLTVAGCSSDDSESTAQEQPAVAETGSADEEPNGDDPAPGGQAEADDQGDADARTANQPGQYVDYSPELVASTQGEKLLFFHAPWCPQCQALEEDIEANGVPDGVTVFKVDYDSNQDLREEYGVTIQTTIVEVDENGDEIDSYVAYDDPTFDNVSSALLQ